MEEKYKTFYRHHFGDYEFWPLVKNLVAVYAEGNYSWHAPIIRLNLPDGSPLIDFINMVSTYSTELE